MTWITRAMLNVGLWGLVRWAERQTKDRLSDIRAKAVRRYIEDRLRTLSLRKQGDVMSQTDLDDTALRFCQVVLKSRWLDQQINAFRGTKD